ncbi:type VII secretion-associated serine protease mycosin [Spirillospora sp. NBC_00431]
MKPTIGRGLVPAVGAVVAAGAVAFAPAAAAAGPPAGACTNPDKALPAIKELPWAQRTLDPKSVWPHSTGKGVTVAVVDSGVDSEHPQLRDGAVLRGEDFHLQGDYPGDFDCASHGTAVASIIAARQAPGVGFAGLAPGARVLPVRVSDRDVGENRDAQRIDSKVLARGIWYAVKSGAKVINLSLAGTARNHYIADAVRHARSKDVVVIAAAGNARQGESGPAYPAAYPGVIGVGALDQSGVLLSGSRTGAHVDLVAPGGNVLAAVRAGGHRYWDGTSVAAAFVSGAATLVRARWPELSADEVAERLVATATPTPGGLGSPAYGAGLINPYRAVTDGTTSASPAPPPTVRPAAADPVRERTEAWWEQRDDTALTVSIATAGAALLALVMAVIFAAGGRGGWRARPAEALPPAPGREEPPDQVFLLDPPTSER